eukprot:Anaeramoba_ignava/c20035_g3_i1.p5 GENE.c20035_g3_i1~~c20035_g3_i1.p5  ORF type:complete len:110 (+),score=16.68 c20035_g3_i1:1437-1766(+)
MPIQPIDLQTLFVKMNQVGREQAAIKNSAVVQQEIQGSEMVKKNQHDDKSVHQAETPESGSEKVKEDGKKGRGNQQQKKMKEKEEEKGLSAEKEILSDPDLGTKIDFSG